MLDILVPPDRGWRQPAVTTWRLQVGVRRAHRAHRRVAALHPAPQGRALRSALARHWLPLAARTRPAPGPGIQPLERTNTSPRDLLQRCEALLRLLLRRRQRVLGIRHRDVVQATLSYDAQRFCADGSPNALAYVMAAMYWRGCSLPSFLIQAPMHPPTGLVRWLSGFSVVDQVDNGRQLFELLALEEARIFTHARQLISRMRRTSAKCRARGVVMLPELLLTPSPSISSEVSVLLPRRPMKSTSWQHTHQLAVASGQ